MGVFNMIGGWDYQERALKHVETRYKSGIE